MNELKRDAAYKNLQSRLNNLLQINTETILSSTFDEEIQNFLTRDYYVKNATIILNNKNKKDFKRENRMNLDSFVPSLNRTQLGEEISTYKMPLHMVCIIVILTIILTCCFTLYLRNKLMALVYKVIGKKKKDRLSQIMDVEKGRRESKNGLMGVKKVQKKENKPVSPDVTQPVPQPTTMITTTSSIQAEPSPTGCSKCFKKKRKKTQKKHKR